MKDSHNLGRVLVTGASGFVGAAVASEATTAGFIVRSTGRSRQPPATLPDYVAADLLDNSDLRALLDGVDYVVHSAGLAHQFRPKRTTESEFRRVNTEAAVKLGEAAKDAGIQHFVLLSSVSVYGPHDSESCDEETPCHPAGAYAKSKYDAEVEVRAILKDSPMKLTILRLATVYGEGDPGNVGRLMRSIDRGRFVWVGSGSNRKSLIHREDVARACIRVLKAPNREVDVFNLSAPACTMREIVEGFYLALGKSPPRWRIPVRPLLLATGVASKITVGRGPTARIHGVLRKWITDDVYPAEKFCQTFGFQPQVQLLDGIRRQVEWYRQSPTR